MLPCEDKDICYPIAEEGITEDIILEWAKTQPIFDNWYKHFTRGVYVLPL